MPTPRCLSCLAASPPSPPTPHLSPPTSHPSPLTFYDDNISIASPLATGISNVSMKNNETVAREAYDLQGRCVNPATYQGIIVIDGKKVVRTK